MTETCKKRKKTTATQMMIFGIIDLFGEVEWQQLKDRMPWHTTKTIEHALQGLIEDGAIERKEGMYRRCRSWRQASSQSSGA